MFRMFTAAPVIQRAATMLGAIFVALAFAVALPGHAEAANVQWSTQNRGLHHCSDYKYLRIGTATVSVMDCLKTYISSGRITYYQGVLEVRFTAGEHASSPVLGGRSMTAHVGSPYADGVNDCPRIAWKHGETRYCYSPTKWRPRGAGATVYGKGILTNSAGSYIALAWSDLLEIY